MGAKYPIRTHPDCANCDCKTCLADHESLGTFLGLHLGDSEKHDWLGEYRTWLDRHAIPAEIHGWATREAFDPKNIGAFIRERSEA